MLVVEDLQADGGGIVVGFCGAIGSLEAASATAVATARALGSTYISLREGQEIDELAAGLLARALRGWLGREAEGDAGWQEEELARGGGEMVDWVDTKGRVICALPRPVVHSRNVLHRGAGVMIRNGKARRRCFRFLSPQPIVNFQASCGGAAARLQAALNIAANVHDL